MSGARNIGVHANFPAMSVWTMTQVLPEARHLDLAGGTHDLYQHKARPHLRQPAAPLVIRESVNHSEPDAEAKEPQIGTAELLGQVGSLETVRRGAA